MYEDIELIAAPAPDRSERTERSATPAVALIERFLGTTDEACYLSNVAEPERVRGTLYHAAKRKGLPVRVSLLGDTVWLIRTADES